MYDNYRQQLNGKYMFVRVFACELKVIYIYSCLNVVSVSIYTIDIEKL